MKKTNLLKLLAQYEKQHSFFLETNVRINLLKWFLEKNNIEQLDDEDDIPFGQFANYLLIFKYDNLASLFDEKYLKGSEKSAALFNEYIKDDSLTPEGEADILLALDKLKNHIPLKTSDDVKPDETHDFKQWRFIFRSKYHSLFNNKISSLSSSGVCTALTFLWYEYLSQGKSLISELNKPELDPYLLKMIDDIQNKYSTLTAERLRISRTFNDVNRYFNSYHPKQKPNIPNKNQAPTSNSDTQTISYAGLVEYFMNALGFSDAIQQTFSPIEMQNQIKSLKEENIKENELQNITISSRFFGVTNGHVIGWTFKDKQYVLFDANTGEHRFKHFQSFQNYLANYLYNYYHTTPEDHCFVSTKFCNPSLALESKTGNSPR